MYSAEQEGGVHGSSKMFDSCHESYVELSPNRGLVMNGSVYWAMKHFHVSFLAVMALIQAWFTPSPLFCMLNTACSDSHYS